MKRKRGGGGHRLPQMCAPASMAFNGFGRSMGLPRSRRWHVDRDFKMRVVRSLVDQDFHRSVVLSRRQNESKPKLAVVPKAGGKGKMSVDKTPVRRGGRFTKSRREEVVRKAALLFIERGYEEVTIDQIVAEVGGSKATVYSRFGGKAALFTVVIEEYCEMISHELKVELDLAGSVEEQLVAIGRTFLALILRRKTLELHRLMVSIGDKFPRVARFFFNAGPAAAYKLVSDWMRRQQEARVLAEGDPDLLAALYLDMLTANHQLARLLSVKSKPDPAGVQRTVEAAAAIFLRGASQDRTTGSRRRKDVEPRFRADDRGDGSPKLEQRGKVLPAMSRSRSASAAKKGQDRLV
jgi:AcrR family transcriptional regulator